MSTVEPRRFHRAPRLPASVTPRERLLRRLDAAAAHPLTIVRTAMGGGKTTLLAAWVHERDPRGFWVAVDESSTSRLGFWRHVLGVGIETGVIPADSILADLAIADESAASLRSALLRGFGGLEGSLIVLDDYHLVTDPLVHEDLHALLSGTELHLLLATRTMSPLEGPAPVARLATQILSPSELLLTAEETAAAASTAGLDGEAAAELHNAFGGWPIAVQGVLAELAAGRTASLDEAIERMRELGAGRMLQRLPDSPYLLFLLRTSIAPQLSAELAAELGGDEAGQHLEQAEREGIGTWAPGEHGLAFGYHEFFRGQLEEELERRRPDDVPRLRAAYAHERTEARDPIGAMRQYAAIGDWGAIIPVVQRHYGDLVIVHRTEALAILESAPGGELRRHPLLLVFLALLRNSTDTLRRDRWLDLLRLGAATLQARLSSSGDPIERVWLLMALMGAQRLSGRYEPAFATTETLAAALRSLDEAQRESLHAMLPSIWTMAAWSHILVGRTESAPALLDQADESMSHGDWPWSSLHVPSIRLLLAAMRGEHAELVPALEEARRRSRPHGWRGSYSSAGFHYAEAYLALEGFDGDAARAQLDELAPHEHGIEHWPLIARLRGLAALVETAAFEGLRRLDQDIAAHDDRPPTSEWMQAQLTLTRVDLLLAAGETHRAHGLLRSAHASRRLPLAAARTALALGRAERAVSLASPVAWSDGIAPRSQAEAFLLVGVAAHRSGREREAITALDHALSLLEAHRLRRPLMMVPRSELAALLDASGIDPRSRLTGVPDAFPSTSRVAPLTAREQLVLAELERTTRIEELAAVLFVSPNTVKTHLRSIYRKLGVSSREEAVTVAHLHGVLERPEQAS